MHSVKEKYVSKFFLTLIQIGVWQIKYKLLW